MLNRLDQVAIVLVKPKVSGNIGAAARALKNMGLADLRIVAPRDWDAEAARIMAVHADDILARARLFTNLLEAVSDRTLTVGTTCRTGPYRSEVQPIREAASILAVEAEANRIAIIFGPEDYGLSNEEIGQCHRLVSIPASPDYPSLNLAQAVMVVAYEINQAFSDTRSPSAAAEFAPADGVEQMFQRMATALEAIGFVSAESADHIMLTIRAMLGRGGLRPRELDILNGMARQIRWFAEGGREVIARKKAVGERIR
jgi:TrmH family RNA methyltransferase